MKKIKILFVCQGNLCRSPLAQAIMQKKINNDLMNEHVEVASSGFSVHLEGHPYHEFTQQICEEFDLPLHGKSQFTDYSMLGYYDYILAMDQQNLRDLRSLDQNHRYENKIKLLMDYSDENEKNIPDPIRMSKEKFLEVFQLMQEACENLWKEIKNSFH